MAIYVYATTTGALYSWNPNDNDPVADTSTLTKNGLTVISGLLPLDATHSWDPISKSVVVVEPPVLPNFIPTFSFVMLFTPTEIAAIRASTDPNVQHWLFALSMAQQIDLADTKITKPGLNYLASVGLITSDRITKILSNEAP